MATLNAGLAEYTERMNQGTRKRGSIVSKYIAATDKTKSRLPSALSMARESGDHMSQTQAIGEAQTSPLNAQETLADQSAPVNAPGQIVTTNPAGQRADTQTAITGIGTEANENSIQAAEDAAIKKQQELAKQKALEFKAPALKEYDKYKSVIPPGFKGGGASIAPVPGKNGSSAWINANIGKYHDFDNAFYAQCVDLYNFYTTGFAGGQSSVGKVDYAYQLWDNNDPSVYTRISASQTPQQGDVVIYDTSWGGGAGHVGIVAGVNSDGTINVLNANATADGPKGNTIISRYSRAGTLGYLRPNVLMGRNGNPNGSGAKFN